MKTILMYFYILIIYFLCFGALYSITYGICVEDSILMLIGAFLFGITYFISKLMFTVFENKLWDLREKIIKLANKYSKEEY